MAKTKLTQDYLKECLTYDPETGIFTWNRRSVSHFKNSHGCNIWNSRWSNKEAGCLSGDGYLLIGIDYETYKAHRLAFLYMDGYIPENYVDHKDKNKLNNKWDNLREASQMCNMQNCNIRIDNTSGIAGVHWSKSKNKWHARITINSKDKHIGYFDNLDDAVYARHQEEVNNQKWTCSVESSALKYLINNNLL